MDMVAAIQAAKNQLEAQKKKKAAQSGSSGNVGLPAVPSGLHPAPPTSIVSFDSKKLRKVSDMDAPSPHPYHTSHQQDYVHPDFQFHGGASGDHIEEGDEDDLTTTSSLSGTLASSVVPDQPPVAAAAKALRANIKAASSDALANLATVNESPTAAAGPSRSKSFYLADRQIQQPPQQQEDHDTRNISKSKSLHAKDFLSSMTLNSAAQVASFHTNPTSNFTNSKGSQDVQVSNATNANSTQNHNNSNNNSNNNNNHSSDVSKRIEEIMSTYQGKVDTILKRRDETANFKSFVETTQGGSASVAASLGTASTDVKSVAEEGSTAGSKSGGERLGIDDILSTYKKKVGEIMEKKHIVALPSIAFEENGIGIPYAPQEHSTSAHPSYPRSIVDDDDEEQSREGVIDNNSVGSRSSGSGSYSGSRSSSPGSSYSGSGSVSRSSYGSSQKASRVGQTREDESTSHESASASVESNNMHLARQERSSAESMQQQIVMGANTHGLAAAAPASGRSSTGPMSERANAILQSCNDDNRQTPAPSSRSLSPRRNIRGGEENANDQDSRSECSEGSYSSQDSYISGASSASDALSAQVECSGTNFDRRVIKGDGPSQDRSMTDGNKKSGKEEPASLFRRDSLQRAQEHLASRNPPKSTKSFYCEPNSTKSNLHAEIESERKSRQDLERRLAELTQREEDLSNNNRRLEKTLADLQAQLEKVQGDARSNKFSQSEQAARIRELERKLKGEQSRVEELEREKETMKEEYDADLEEQKDINRQLEQMVMSEEFEKELEDEINQVKELEHANRRFKVKIDMLEREKNTITKKFEAKIDELTNKNKTMEDQLAEFESKASTLESSNRNTVMDLEAKLAAETSRVRELELSIDSTTSKYNSKLKSLEIEMAELREASAKIDEYEQVLGKLMERNNELEAEAKQAREERDMANRQVELSDRRRAVKIKDLEEQVAEQKLMIEQQQETLDESVKTILKLYSLNSGKGDDMTSMSEDQLDSIARAMIPRAPTKPSLPTVKERSQAGIDRAWSRGRDRFEEIDVDKSVSRAVDRARSRGRDRFDELDMEKSVARSVARARSQVRDRLEDVDKEKSVTRAKSRGRGDRSESIRQLASRALDSGRDKSRSPPTRRLSTDDRMYDPTGPNSLALVPVIPKETDERYGGHYGMPPSRSSSRRGGSSVYDRIDSTYTDGAYSSALISQQDYESINRPRHRNNYHQYQSHDERDRNRYVDRDDRSRGDRRDRGDDRSRRSGKSHRDERRNRGDDRGDERSRGGRSHRDDRQRDRERGGGWGESSRRRDTRHQKSQGYREEYDRRVTRDPSVYGDVEGGRSHNHSRHRPRGKQQQRSSHARDP